MAKKTTDTDKKASKTKSNKKEKRSLSLDATLKAVSFRVDDNVIRERAYGIWIAEGRPHGRDQAHWQLARRELLAAQ
jgi:hypothetical protein